MNNLYRSLVLLFFLASTHLVSAQANGTLSGKLQDTKGTAVGFANVAVLRTSDSVAVTGAITDAAGSFAVKTPLAGKYLLRISLIGYANTNTPPFEVTDENYSKDFGTLTLKENTKQLAEVKVQALRPTIVTHPDKMVVSVEGTALTAGNTAYDVLTKSPGVFVDQDGNIQLNGKSGVRIMLDGKLTYLSGKELQTMLQGMAAENLKDLEIITNPSAKYDAEGTAGIININLKKNDLTGINGSVYGGLQYNGLQGFSGGGNINHKKGKWNSFANLDVARRTQLRIATFTRLFKGEERSTSFDQDAREEGIRDIPTLRLGTDYDINKKHSVGVMANLMLFRADNDFRTDTYLRNGNVQQDSLTSATNLINGSFYNTTFNAHYSGKLDTTGTTLTADLDYVALRDKREAEFINYTKAVSEPGLGRLDLLTSENRPMFNIYSAKVDFTKPLNKNTKFELGAKASHVTSDSDLKFFNYPDEVKSLDLRKSNHFIYKENIFAGYANFSTSLGEKFKVQAGLRAEKTDAEGYSVTTDSTNARNYLNLFPSLFITQKVNKDYQITYNYSRRINRPRYEALNPFVFYLDKYTYASGNPYLRPQYTNSFQVVQMFKNTYNLTLGYAVTNDFMAEIPEQFVETRITIFQQRNVDQFKDLSATLVAPIKISAKWDISNNLTLSHQDYTIMMNEQALRNEQLFFYAQSTSNIQLPKKFRLELNGVYQGASAYGLYKIAANWGVDVGIKKTFLTDKLEASLNVTDIFRTRRIIGKANYNGNINEFNQYFGQQSLRFNLRYRFNKGSQFEAKKRNTNLEELNRAGGN